MKRNWFISILTFVGAVSILYVFWHQPKVDFSADVKPILNQHCISCHGGVKKNAGFSLLFENEALGATESGHPAIIPGDASESEFISRLKEKDPELRMPYNKPPLSDEEIKTLTDWVNQGAQWGNHWAYELPEKVEIPHTTLKAGFSKENAEPFAKN
ncbi:MAG: c-type cytochrome domain-containing protein, partial [Cyclobacteriaceae bacterium]